MSRIGKQPIPVPAGVTVTIEGNKITTKGPKGELSYEFNPMMSIAQEGEELIVSRPDDSREAKAFHGLTRSLVNNMVHRARPDAHHRFWCRQAGCWPDCCRHP